MTTNIRKLNTLRGLAALIVLISHFSNKTQWLGGILGFGAGQFGVMLFFILSGFLMAYLYINKPLNRKSFRQFAVARVARVVPLFLLVVLLSFALYKANIREFFFFIPTVKFLTAHLLFLNGVDILWTIPPEIHFYIFFVGLWWLHRTSPRIFLCLVVSTTVAIYLLGAPIFKFRLFGLPVEIRLFLALPYFYAGVLMGLLYHYWQAPAKLQSHAWLLALIMIFLLFPGILSLFTDWQHRYWQDFPILLAVASVFFALVFLVPERNPLLESRAGDFLGQISYSLYLLHMPILMILPETVLNYPWLALVIFMCIAVVCSWLSYRVLEKPARAIIRGHFSNSGQ